MTNKMRSSSSIVIAKLPRAGLGNKLFVWARAVCFANENQLDTYTIGLNRIHIGPFLRNEKVKRFYLGQFKRNSITVFFKYLKSKILNYKSVIEPNISVYEINSPIMFVFDTIPSWKDYFGSLHLHRQLIIEEFHQLLSKKSNKYLLKYPNPPSIGVHIRMGDFKQLKEGEDFKSVGATRTPLEYFKDCITKIRERLGNNMPVIVYTDGYPSELEEILNLDNTFLNKTKLDITDLISLSRSTIIITSAHSSFSEWAGFISNAPIIRHPDHIHGKIRPEGNLFEGTITQYVKTVK